MIESTEDPSRQADVLVDLADVYYQAGQHVSALDALDDAERRYAAKGNPDAGVRVARIARRVADGLDPLAQ